MSTFREALSIRIFNGCLHFNHCNYAMKTISSFYGSDICWEVQVEIQCLRALEWMFLMVLLLLCHHGRKTFEASQCSYGTLKSLHSGCYITKICDPSHSRNDSPSLNFISVTKSQSFSSNDQRTYIRWLVLRLVNTCF